MITEEEKKRVGESYIEPVSIGRTIVKFGVRNQVNWY